MTRDDEARVRARLREYGSAITPVSDIPAAGRARWRRRVRRQRAAAVVASVVVVAAVVGVTVQLARRPSGDRNLQFATNGSSSPSAPAPTTAYVAGRVVSGRPLADTTWISADEGWALVQSEILRTTDGGRVWHAVSRAPVPVVPAQAPLACVVKRCVGRIRFADAKHGWLFGATFFSTDDGGATWRDAGPDSVFALEVANRRAYRVSTAPGCTGDCQLVVSTSTVGSNRWQSLTTPNLTGFDAALIYEGSRLYVIGRDVTLEPRLLRSLDGGAHWQERPDPCTSTPGDPARLVMLAATPERYLVAGCQPVDLDRLPFVRTSSDAGSSFGPARMPSLPPRNFFGAIATGTPRSITVVVTEGNTWRLFISRDDGATWRMSLQTPVHGHQAALFLGYETSRTGRFGILEADRLWTTHDGGDTWTVGHP